MSEILVEGREIALAPAVKGKVAEVQQVTVIPDRYHPLSRDPRTGGLIIYMPFSLKTAQNIARFIAYSTIAAGIITVLALGPEWADRQDFLAPQRMVVTQKISDLTGGFLKANPIGSPR